jgi:hypothetical protein
MMDVGYTTKGGKLASSTVTQGSPVALGRMEQSQLIYRQDILFIAIHCLQCVQSEDQAIWNGLSEDAWLCIETHIFPYRRKIIQGSEKLRSMV